MDKAVRLFNRTGRFFLKRNGSFSAGSTRVFGVRTESTVVLDPFCGAGAAALAARAVGARIVATDPRPEAVFLTQVALRPLALPALEAAFARLQSRLQPGGTDRETDAATVASAIARCPAPALRAALHYVFLSARLEQERSAPAGPASRRTSNLPDLVRRRFARFCQWKEAVQRHEPLCSLRITADPAVFDNGAADALVAHRDWPDALAGHGPAAQCIFVDWPGPPTRRQTRFNALWESAFHGEPRSNAPAPARLHPAPDSLLKQLARHSEPACRIVLTRPPGTGQARALEAALSEHGYRAESDGCLSCGHAHPRPAPPNGATLPPSRRRDGYQVVGRSEPRPPAAADGPRADEQTGRAYLRAHAGWKARLRATRKKTDKTEPGGFPLPLWLCPLCDRLSSAQRRTVTADPTANRRAWHALCLAHIAALLRRDGIRLLHLSPAEAEPGLFGLPEPAQSEPCPATDAAAVFARPDSAQRWHVFFEDQPVALRQGAARDLARRETERAVLVFPDRTGMEPWRAPRRAASWPGGLFMAFDEIRAECERLVPADARRLGAALPPVPAARRPEQPRNAIARLSARVKSHVQVGGADSPYGKLQIEAEGLADIAPGQFVMLDTAPRNVPLRQRPVAWSAAKTSFPLEPTPYLKRPFGIHRALYSDGAPPPLPPSLSILVHRIRPRVFDIFYKTLPHGTGTAALRRVPPGARLRLLGPLGRVFDLAALVRQGIDEVHVVGGGVGMAPLVFLVQTLRFMGLPVKAFIGIEHADRLRYRHASPAALDPDLETDGVFEAEPRDAHIYIDDLKQVGLDASSLFLCTDRAGGAASRLVPPGHYRTGRIPDLHADCWARGTVGAGRVAVFACGPMPMMQAVHQTARAHGARLHVLLEKRMACGIGVCLSCVCHTRQGYARVCREGPLFEASDILWP